MPVPGRSGSAGAGAAAARLLGWSAIADLVVRRLGIQKGWYFDEVRALPSRTGETIACLLMSKLAAVGVPVVVLAQYSRAYIRGCRTIMRADFRAIRKVLGCAAKAGLVALDEYDWLMPTSRRAASMRSSALTTIPRRAIAAWPSS